jgi:hypothetical protein
MVRRLHKFAMEVSNEQSWLGERLAAVEAPAAHASATAALKQHAKLLAELTGRAPIVQRVLAQGRDLLQQDHPQADKVRRV